jgi:transposase
MKKTKHLAFPGNFKKGAVQLIGTSGRTLAQVAKDHSIGLSNLSRWKQQFNEADLLADPHEDVIKELARLRKK